MLIGDLVHVPPVRTVIRLADLENPELRRHLADNFVLTGEAAFTLTAFFDRVAAGHGEGFFVVGNYGSGKSHLLNMISLLIGDTGARGAFVESCLKIGSPGSRLPALLERAAALNPLVAEISLVEHSSREYLEQIVLKAIASRLKADPPDGRTEIGTEILQLTRQEAFEEVRRGLAGRGHKGLVLLVDELSEFLRSKENSRAYNEDVRFLQYLGEFAETIPAWIMATMQENIENTGSLSGEMLHKIKDRYPRRFQLSGEHVKEIVSGRLVKKKEPAGKALPLILRQMQEAFATLPFSASDFRDLYPVHPATVELLDELRPLFSQHRGVIDFIHYRLAGDPGRGIPPFLESPAEELLTPDYIFDHFRDRLRETVETSPYSEEVYHYFEREAGRIFSDRDEAVVALRLVKLLILGALARAPQSYSADELTRLLLYRYSDLESGVNYDFIKETMARLHAHGAYVSAVESTEGDTRYSIDLKADVALLMQKKLEHLSTTFDPGDTRIIDGLLPWIDESYLPLKKLQREPRREEKITWQNTTRHGKVFFASPAELSIEALNALREELLESETDFVFFVVPPYYAGGEESADAWQTVYGECPEELRRSLALWLPRGINKSEEEQLRRAYAHLLLQEEYRADSSPVGKQVGKQLEVLAREEQAGVKELFRNIYFQGRLRAGEHMPAPGSFGYLPFADLVSNAAAEILKERFPRHYEIRPLGEELSGSLIQRTLDELVGPGPEGEEHSPGIRKAIEACLAPLGLVKKKGRGYQLEINPKSSPLAAELLGSIPEAERVPLNRLYRRLRQGPFGLSAGAFQVLGTAAVLSGALSAYQGGKRLSPSQVNYYRFWKIEELGPGTLIHPGLQKVLGEVPFLPPKLRGSPLTYANQQQIWEEIIAFKMEWTRKAAEIESRIERLREHPFFDSANWEQLAKTAARLASFLDEIKTSYSSREGLERFLASFQSSPLIGSDWNRLSALEQFFAGDLPEILRIGHYMRDGKLRLPDADRYDSLRRRFKTVVELLEEESLLWEEKYRERLKREFRQFRTEYAAAYLEEHGAAVGAGRIGPYRDILNSGAYRLLEQLGRINTVMVKNDLVEVNRLLALPLERECSAADELKIEERPACSCGFTMGETLELPPVAGLEVKIVDGARAYLETLQGPQNRQKIEAHAEGLELVGRRREAEPLQKLLKLDRKAPGAELVGSLTPLVNQGTVAQINHALTGNAMIAERSADALTDMLADRVFNSAQLKDIFTRWLNGGETGTPDYIRVTRRESPYLVNRDGGDESPGEPGQGARPLLEEKFPGLLALAGTVGIEKVFATAMLSAWLRHQCGAGAGSGESKGESSGAEVEEIAQLLEEQTALGRDERKSCLGQLSELGEHLLAERESLTSRFMENAAAAGVAMIPAKQLLEKCYRNFPGGAHRFDALLDLFTDEPFFPAVGREIAGRMAERIAAEESAPQLNIMAGMLLEARRSGAREGTGLTTAHRTGKLEQLDHLHALARCGLILREVERISESPPGSDRNWEKLYRLFSPFELLLGNLESVPDRTPVPGITLRKWRKSYASLLEPLAAAFSAHISREAPSRRQTLAELIGLLPGWAEKEGGGLFLVILDGARLDIWEALLEKHLARGSYQVLREGLLWALPPTVTENQVRPLIDLGLIGHILNMDDSLVTELISDPQAFLQAAENSSPRRGKPGPLKALKYNFVDQKIHLSRDSLPLLLEELQLQGGKKIQPLLDCLPGGALVMLTADHGFKTNLFHNKTDKEDPLYLHGGDTFFEVLTPWALLKKK